MPTPRLRVLPLSADRWPDFERLFGKNGACGGCWCMLWRLPRATFDAQKGDGNRRAMKALVDDEAVPGLLAYRGDEVVGWCALAPRSDYPALARSRLFRPIDDAPVWSVSCLFVARAHRDRGVSVALLKAAVKHANANGARIVEGYPQEPRRDRMADAFAWTGIASAFVRAGFREVARPSPTRPCMRHGP